VIGPDRNGVIVQQYPVRAAKQRRSGCFGCFGVFAVFAILAIALGAWTVRSIDAAVPGFFDDDGIPADVRAEALVNIFAADLGEDPHLASRTPDGDLPLCSDVSEAYDKAFTTAFGLMRATQEGRQLYDLLEEHGICVRVDDLPYNSAYSSSSRRGSDWSSSRIVIDRRQVRTIGADVLAAILIHEATHIRRTIDGSACFYERPTNEVDPCETLSNGVMVVEEAAAHSAEAEFWIALYGENGKSRAYNDASYENSLADAYEQGSVAFESFVRRGRSDPREGEGFRE
jgi:hypothetical protein